MLHAILATDDGREQLDAACDAYQRLWRAGRIDSPEMQGCFAGLLDYLRAAGLDPANNSAFNELIASGCFRAVTDGLEFPDCDPQFRRMVDSLLALVS
jgi:hypothetical protein